MAHRFYTNSPLALGPAVLQGPEAHHLAVVCRFREGDPVILFNGDGREYHAEILSVDRKSVALQVHEVLAPARELPFRLEVAAPMPKGDRGDFLIEKLTELGVTDFTPLRTERSVVHPRETKLERLQRTVIEASKQCGRNSLMQVHDLADWPEYLTPRPGELRLIADPLAAQSVTARGGQDVRLAIGPEGGFTPGEMTLALAAGWEGVTLGPRILRIETAALALAARLSSS